MQLTDAQVGAAGCVSGTAPGGATARAGAWSVFGGAVAGTSLRADLLPTAGGPNWHLRAKVDGLTVDGAPVDPIAGASIAVGDWGVLDVHALVDGKAIQPLRYWAVGARADADEGARRAARRDARAARLRRRRPALRAAASARAAEARDDHARHHDDHAAAADDHDAARHHDDDRDRSAEGEERPALDAEPAKPKVTAEAEGQAEADVTGQPLKGTPPLGAGSYVFPVDGHTDWGDSYGAERSDVPGGWHHGDDLFAPLGTPIVAVTDGIVFSVGWNKVGGWRLWLLDANGNQYYYAHLSGYTAAGSNDRTVAKGQVLGFVGNTGDAVTTLPHLHFEVHPSSLLYLGYDGAVDPTSYLRGWSLAKNVVVPPPVDLPSKAPPGRGSAADFRQLLSIHPLQNTR